MQKKSQKSKVFKDLLNSTIISFLLRYILGINECRRVLMRLSIPPWSNICKQATFRYDKQIAKLDKSVSVTRTQNTKTFYCIDRRGLFNKTLWICNEQVPL
jgi:hypothetical protein